MATVSTTQQEKLIALTTMMFDAPPGAQHLAGLSAQLEAGQSIRDIAADLAATEAFRAQFSDIPSDKGKIDKALSIAGIDEESPGYDQAFNYFNDNLKAGANPGVLLWQAADFLATTDDETFSSASRLLNNKVDVGSYYSVALGRAATDLDQLRSVVADVTTNPDSVAQAAQQVNTVSGDGGGSVSNVNIEQLSIQGVENNRPDSSLGRITLDYQGAEAVQYVNVNVDGRWVAQNMSVEPSQAGSTEDFSTIFDFGVEEGRGLENVDVAVSVTDEPIVFNAPAEDDISVEVVDNIDFRIGGESDIDQNLIDVAPLIDVPDREEIEELLDEIVVKSGSLKDEDQFTNQQQDKNECAVTAVSNSLKYLQATDQLADDVDSDKQDMKDLLGFDPDRGTPANWHETKEGINGLSVSRIDLNDDDGVSSQDVDALIEALNDGCDVELDLKGHVAVVSGVRMKADGEVELDIYDDNQTDDKVDGEETVTVDTSGDAPSVLGMEMQRFVVECPANDNGNDSAEAGVQLVGTMGLEAPADAMIG